MARINVGVSCSNGGTVTVKGGVTVVDNGGKDDSKSGSDGGKK